MSDEQPRVSLHLSAVIAAVMAAGGSSGLTLYMAPDVRNDIYARADPYTGAMHKQFSALIDQRFAAITDTYDDYGDHINEMRKDHNMILRKEGECSSSLVKLIEKYHGGR